MIELSRSMPWQKRSSRVSPAQSQCFGIFFAFPRWYVRVSFCPPRAECEVYRGIDPSTLTVLWDGNKR